MYLISLLVIIHKFVYASNDKRVIRGEKNLLICIILNIIIRFCNYSIYLLLKLVRPWSREIKVTKAYEGVVVSLTSFPKRIGTVWMTIYSIILQSVRPEQIRLYLSECDFPNKRKDLPKSLLALENHGLIILFVKENLKPHKKYFYVTQELPEKIIITIDDDLFYRRDMVEQLLYLHRIYPHAVCANATHLISIDWMTQNVQPYSKWNTEIYESPVVSHQLIAIGYNGVLYPPFIFKNNPDIHQKNLIVETCLNADDLWLKAQEIMSEIPVCANRYYCAPPTIPATSRYSLQKTNTGSQLGNDIQWGNINQLCGINNKLIQLVRKEKGKILPPPNS